MRVRSASLGALLACALAVAACGGQQSTLDPHSKPAQEITTLWWVMLVIAVVVFAGACAMLLLAVVRRAPGLPFFGERDDISMGLVVVFGIAVPCVVLVGVFLYSNVGVLQDTEAPDPSTTPLTVEVTGDQWFWKVRYPGTAAVTANEIHVPVKTRVNVVTRADDVIHSFWIPQLNRKVDSLPGHPNRVLIYADHPGRYVGQCAEFCGLQHANMRMEVVADPPAQFKAFLANMAKPRVAPTTPLLKRGEQVFLSNQCASCHTIRGTSAKGEIGPDLTHLQARQTLAALTIPNRKGYLGGWVLDPQHIKPGNRMPTLKLSGPDFQALLAYLESLK